MNLSQCMMEAAGAGPAIGPAEDGLITMVMPNSIDFPGGEIQRFIPGYFAPVFPACPVSEHRRGDALRIIDNLVCSLTADT